MKSHVALFALAVMVLCGALDFRAELYSPECSSIHRSGPGTMFLGRPGPRLGAGLGAMDEQEQEKYGGKRGSGEYNDGKDSYVVVEEESVPYTANV